ncbi:class I SAM-dependent DNA methyltransferase [Deinococcus sp. Marseille-Q6407]|uniref:class I SAM-dependent DNA methyltransferase n=1 Tax=Deinococcus sp. Marseille-Q6407 TaxID=2969223 RepID=UPI0021BE388A|nr:class I SAM-dependent DNA methyltransferase [Deinococcus sp. Marseille-Q6407]
MNPQDFADKWRQLAPHTSERAGYQEHFRDLCALVGEPTPSSDTTGQDYAFEKAVKKAGTGEQGFADVFKRGHFICEYKAKGKSLGKALQQALLYARELDNPPLLIVSDLNHTEVHTNFTGSSPRRFDLSLDDITYDRPVAGDLTALQILRAAFTDPARLDPRQLRERVTQDATAKIGEVAASLRKSEAGSQTQIAHFLMRVVFAMFSEDVGLLERGLLTRLLEAARRNPAQSQGLFSQLFGAMRGGGYFGVSEIRHFNGGLFDDDSALPLTVEQIDDLLAAARLDWSEVEPAIFGTLFEGSLEKDVRKKRGAHYTGVQDILRIVEPVIMQPLRREWEAVKAEAEAQAQKRGGKRRALETVQAFRERLGAVRVLDPACGSGNFLVVALTLLLDLDQETRVTAMELGAGAFDVPPIVHPRQFHGIEIEPFAHELASVSIWIAFFQWQAAHGGQWPTPVLQRLHTIENRDALLNEDGTEAAWPQADFIVGNPPFLGDKKLKRVLGDDYVAALRGAYGERLPGQSDLVCYWPEKARALIEAGEVRAAGFVTTNSIRGGKNRTVLERIKETGDLFMAWSDEPWLQDGAAVRVSLFGFDGGQEKEKILNGQPVAAINADLSSRVDVNQAVPLKENEGLAFIGTQKGGKFEISAAQAERWLRLPNPDGVSNADVIRPWVNGMDLTRRPRGMYIIDFNQMTESEAARYVEPFEYVRREIKPGRDVSKDAPSRERWWLHQRSRPEMREAFQSLKRYIAIARLAKHLLPVWMDVGTLPDSQVVAVAADSDFTFGVLNSSIHAQWARTMGTALEDRPRYTPSTCFQTFPFPRPTPEQRAEVEKWARYLDSVRSSLLAEDGATLTGIYNGLESLRENPDSGHPVMPLLTAHTRLDEAVAAAYGWEWPLTEEEVLGRLLALNGERAHANLVTR